MKMDLQQPVKNQKSSALGKGLASLLPGARPSDKPQVYPKPEEDEQQVSSGADRIPGISLTDPREIKVNPYQPRRDFDKVALEELKSSIKENGILQPLVVRREGNKYELIAGERRLRASIDLGLQQVPIVIRKSTDRESLELALVENIQRSNLNCVESAMAYFRLMQEFSLSQEDVAKKVGKDRTSVSNHLRLLRLPEGVRNALREGKITFGHGKALLGLEDQDLRLELCRQIVETGMSVREAEEWVKSKNAPADTSEIKGSEKPDAEKSKIKQRLEKVSLELTRNWGTRVEVKGNSKRGKILLHYSSRQDLERILEELQKDHQWKN